MAVPSSSRASLNYSCAPASSSMHASPLSSQAITKINALFETLNDPTTIIKSDRDTEQGISTLREKIKLTALKNTVKELAPSSFQDSLLEEMIKWEIELPSLMAAKSDQLAYEEIKVATQGGEHTFLLAVTPPDTFRFASDNGRTKMKRLIGELKNSSSLCWADYTFKSLKTCTSILANQDQTYSGDLGVLFYLSLLNPEDHEGIYEPDDLVAAAAHDILSPSECGTPSSRSAVRQYLFHQEIFKVTAIFVEYLLKEIKVTSPEALSLPSTFYKTYYTEKDLSYTLITQIGQLIEEFKKNPSHLKELRITLDDLEELRFNVSTFLSHDFFINKGIQRQATTGWDLLLNEGSHFLHPHQRSIYQLIESQLTHLIKEAFPLNEPMNKHAMHDFLKNKTDLLFKNTVINLTENSSIQEARTHFEATQEFLSQIESYILDYITELLSTYSPPTSSQSSGMCAVPSSAPSIEDKNLTQHITSLFFEKVVNKSPPTPSFFSPENLQLIYQELKYEKYIYTEVQFLSQGLFIQGIGIKKAILNIIGSETFLFVQEKYHEYTEAKDFTEKGQQKCFENFKEAATELQKNLVAEAQPKNFEELESAILTYHMMQIATERKIPLYIHAGPSSKT